MTRPSVTPAPVQPGIALEAGEEAVKLEEGAVEMVDSLMYGKRFMLSDNRLRQMGVYPNLQSRHLVVSEEEGWYRYEACLTTEAEQCEGEERVRIASSLLHGS